MPGYIGYKPQFNPISLQEYLTVPAMIIEGRQREADKIEQYKNEAEKWRTLMGDSPEAKALWENYDKELNNLGDDIMSNKAGDIARTARRLVDTYRGIKYKAEKAEARRERDRELFAKNPDIIGNLGDFMNYYNDDAYSSPYVNGKQLLENVGTFATSYANMLPEKRIGYVDPETKHDIIYERGLDQNEKDNLVKDALSDNPITQGGIALRNALTSSGVDVSNKDALKLANSYIERGLTPLNKTRRTQQNPEWQTPAQRVSTALGNYQLQEARRNFEIWGTTNPPKDGYVDTNVASVDGVDWNGDNLDNNTKESARRGLRITPKGTSGNVIIEKWNNKNKRWEAVREYVDSNGEKHTAVEAGGMFYKPSTKTTTDYGDLTEEEYRKGLNDLPAFNIMEIDDAGAYTKVDKLDFGAADQWDTWEEIPQASKTALISDPKRSSNKSQAILRRAINEGIYSVYTYKGRTFLVKNI